jgi:hypothetical protein
MSAQDTGPSDGVWRCSECGQVRDQVLSVVNDMARQFLALRTEHESLVAHWCKDGETLAERLQRERDDSLALMGLLAKAKQRAKDAEDRHAEVLAAAVRWSKAVGVRDYKRDIYKESRFGDDFETMRREYNDACGEVCAAESALRALVAAQGPEGGEHG